MTDLPTTAEILHNWPIGRPNRRPYLDQTIDQWIAIAERVLAGEFARADGTTKKALRIGLRNILRGRCQEACRMLKSAVRAGAAGRSAVDAARATHEGARDATAQASPAPGATGEGASPETDGTPWDDEE